MTRNSAHFAARIALAAMACACSLAPAAAQGPIGTLQRGPYACELPGDADGAAGSAQPDASFSVRSASRYSAAQGEGVYLRRGDHVEMTSGPRRGESYAIVSEGMLRRVEHGHSSRLRCVLGKS